LHARKPEGSLAAVEARRREYLEMIGTLPEGSVEVVDATRSENAVLAELLRIADVDGTVVQAGPRRAGDETAPKLHVDPPGVHERSRTGDKSAWGSTFLE
jgi:hypothetical protein